MSDALTNLSTIDMSSAVAMLADPSRRWFCSGQDRSGLVARMVAMRLKHAGYPSYAVGESTTPAVEPGDARLMISGTGETQVTVQLARTALDIGAELLAVTANAESSVARLARARL